MAFEKFVLASYISVTISPTYFIPKVGKIMRYSLPFATSQLQKHPSLENTLLPFFTELDTYTTLWLMHSIIQILNTAVD